MTWTLASPAMPLGHTIDFQQYFSSSLRSRTKSITDNSYLVPCSLSLWKRVKSATTGVLSRLENTNIVFVASWGNLRRYPWAPVVGRGGFGIHLSLSALVHPILAPINPGDAIESDHRLNPINFYSAPVGERNIAISLSVCVYVCVCPRAYLWNRWNDLHEILCVDLPWPLLGPPLVALRYVMYFRFYGW